MGIETGTALLVSSLIAAAASGAQTAASIDAAHNAAHAQKESQKEAAAAQKEADAKAQKQRLDALAANQEATDYSNVWGVEANKYKDAAQKLSAGTGSFNADDEENPFYTRGLI